MFKGDKRIRKSLRISNCSSSLYTTRGEGAVILSRPTVSGEQLELYLETSGFILQESCRWEVAGVPELLPRRRLCHRGPRAGS